MKKLMSVILSLIIVISSITCAFVMPTKATESSGNLMANIGDRSNWLLGGSATYVEGSDNTVKFNKVGYQHLTWKSPVLIAGFTYKWSVDIYSNTKFQEIYVADGTSTYNGTRPVYDETKKVYVLNRASAGAEAIAKLAEINTHFDTSALDPTTLTPYHFEVEFTPKVTGSHYFYFWGAEHPSDHAKSSTIFDNCSLTGEIAFSAKVGTTKNNGIARVNGKTETKVQLGQTATFTATPYDDTNFKGWYKADGTLVSEEATYSFVVNQDSDLTALDLTARFDKDNAAAHLTHENWIDKDNSPSISDRTSVTNATETYYQGGNGMTVSYQGEYRATRLTIPLRLNTDYTISFYLKIANSSLTQIESLCLYPVGVTYHTSGGNITKVSSGSIIKEFAKGNTTEYNDGQWHKFTYTLDSGSNATIDLYLAFSECREDVTISDLTVVPEKIYEVSANTAATANNGIAKADVADAIVGETVTFTATPNPDTKFLGWYKADGTLVNKDITYTVPVTEGMAEENLQLTAKFNKTNLIGGKTHADWIDKYNQIDGFHAINESTVKVPDRTEIVNGSETYNGGNAIQFNITDPFNSDANKQYNVATMLEIPVAKNTDYTFSFWYKTERVYEVTEEELGSGTTDGESSPEDGTTDGESSPEDGTTDGESSPEDGTTDGEFEEPDYAIARYAVFGDTIYEQSQNIPYGEIKQLDYVADGEDGEEGYGEPWQQQILSNYYGDWAQATGRFNSGEHKVVHLWLNLNHEPFEYFIASDFTLIEVDTSIHLDFEEGEKDKDAVQVDTLYNAVTVMNADDTSDGKYLNYQTVGTSVDDWPKALVVPFEYDGSSSVDISFDFRYNTGIYETWFYFYKADTDKTPDIAALPKVTPYYITERDSGTLLHMKTTGYDGKAHYDDINKKLGEWLTFKTTFASEQTNLEKGTYYIYYGVRKDGVNIDFDNIKVDVVTQAHINSVKEYFLPSGGYDDSPNNTNIRPGWPGGTKPGIRFKTFVSKKLIEEALPGYEVVEYGTIAATENGKTDTENVEDKKISPFGFLTYEVAASGKRSVLKGSAYEKATGKNVVYRQYIDWLVYTGVVTGMKDYTANYYARPYIVLQNIDKKIVIYGHQIYYTSMFEGAYRTRNDYSSATFIINNQAAYDEWFEKNQARLENNDNIVQ